MDESELDIMGTLMAETSMNVSGEAEGLFDMIVRIVPWNFFESLGKGETISIVFACVFVRLGIGFARGKAVDDLLAMVDVVSEAFNVMFKWAVNFLPIGVCCVIADQVAGLSPAILGGMLDYIAILYFAVALLLLFYVLVMSMFIGKPFMQCLKVMKDPLLLAFTANSSFIAIKPSLDSLDKIPGVDRRISSPVVSFSMVANKQGKILVFAFTSIFLAQLFGIELGVPQYATVIIGSAPAGMAAPGSGPLLAPMAAVVIASIGVPSALAVAIFTINSPIVDRTLSALTVQESCLMASLSAKIPDEKRDQEKNDWGDSFNNPLPVYGSFRPGYIGGKRYLPRPEPDHRIREDHCGNGGYGDPAVYHREAGRHRRRS